jgi:hypothetical protein
MEAHSIRRRSRKINRGTPSDRVTRRDARLASGISSDEATSVVRRHARGATRRRRSTPAIDVG